MKRYGPAVLLFLSGAAILRISLFSELYLRYVQPGLRPFLIASGVLLVLLAAAAAIRTARAEEAHEDEQIHGDGQIHGEHHHTPTGPRVAWLLAVPALALLLFPPPALGSYSAEREAAQYTAQGVGTFPELPAGDPVDLTLGEFSSRAIYDSERSLEGRTVRMTGFVTRGDGGSDGDGGDDGDGAEAGTWYLTRLLVSCCAADASSYRIEVRGADAPPADTWVTLTGTWHPEGEPGSEEAWPLVLNAASVRTIKAPANPYEKR